MLFMAKLDEVVVFIQAKAIHGVVITREVLEVVMFLILLLQ